MATGRISDADIFSDEIFDVICSICEARGKNTEGEKICIECGDYFCVKCVNIHNMVPSCARHQLLDIAKVKQGSSNRLEMVRAKRCDRHNHKHIDMYCVDHDKVGCSTCMVVDHKLCTYTFYIPSYLKNSEHRVATAEIQRRLKTISETVKEQTDKYNEDKRKLIERKSELLIDIRRFKQQINDLLDELERRSVAEIESKLKNLESKIEESLNQLNNINVKVTGANNKLSSVNINQAERFVFMKIGEETANVAMECIENIGKDIKYESIYFNPDRTLNTLLEKSESLGAIDSLIQVKGGKSYNVKVESDKKACDITSACYMEDGSIILADNSNRKLKRLDSNTYLVRDFCELPGFPWQVCPISNSQVAITLRSEGIHFISLEGAMKAKGKINTDFICSGLAYANNNLYISDINRSLYIYSFSGRKLRQFSKDQSGQRLFSKTQSLAVSKDATRIYVADYDHGLIVLDNNGHVVSKYNGGNSRGARCCYLTERGSVMLVSGELCSNVLQFTCDGDLMGTVLETDGTKGRIGAVWCNQQMSEICINSFVENNITVYGIEAL